VDIINRKQQAGWGMSESPTVYNLLKRKARKLHKCCECDGWISKGEVYNLHTGLWNCEWNSFKVCVDCEDLRDKIKKECDLYQDEVPALGQMFVELADYDECTGYSAELSAIYDKRTSAGGSERVIRD